MNINPADWPRLSQLLDQALDLTVEELDTWIARLPLTDLPLSEPLRQILQGRARVETRPVLDARPDFARALLAESARHEAGGYELAAGAMIGPYRLLRELGAGGMATVWLAQETGRLKRQVALKFPHAGPLQRQLAGRLARERDILASLEHPNIARLYGAEVSAKGSPFLVLEYVDGVPIDTYCGELELPVRERLKLFMQVFEAVQYAHARLVVHRDIKPSNVLVTRDGLARLLDFGVAKLLSDGLAHDTALTQFSGRAITPAYASPEQVIGGVITTASDVYSLGVVLYELLVGTRPYGVTPDNPASLRIAAAEVDAIVPSRAVTPTSADPAAKSVAAQRARQLRGDLDAILLKALQKECSARYATVDAFREDIERYLDGMPVQARTGRGYRLRKFLRRNRVATAAGAAVVVSLSAGLGVALWQAREARLQRDEARLESQRADAEASFLNAMMSDLGEPNEAITPIKVLEKGLDVVAAQYQDNPEAAVDVLIGMSGRFMDMGDHRRELDALTRAEKIARPLPGSLALAKVQCNAVETEIILGNMERAAARLAEGQAALKRAARARIDDELTCLDAGAALSEAKGRTQEAIATLERSVSLRERNGLTLRIGFAPLLQRLGGLYTTLGDINRAYQYDHEARLNNEQQGRTGTTNWAASLHNESLDLFKLGEWRAALEQESKVVSVYGAQGADAPLPANLAITYANMLTCMARMDEALEWLDRAEINVARGGDAYARVNLHIGRAWTLLRMRRLDAAEVELDAIDDLTRDRVGPFRVRRDRGRLFRADLLFQRGAFAEARDTLAPILASARDRQSGLSLYLDDALLLSAHIDQAQGRLAEAASQASEALRLDESRSRAPAQSAAVGAAALQLAKLKLQQGERLAALTLVNQAVVALVNSAGAAHALTREASNLQMDLAR